MLIPLIAYTLAGAFVFWAFAGSDDHHKQTPGSPSAGWRFLIYILFALLWPILILVRVAAVLTP